MKKIPISGRKGHGVHALVDDKDYKRLSKYRWWLSNGYAYRGEWNKGYQKHFQMHHEVFGKPPKGKVVDHINYNKLDNRSSNLRFCTHSQNRLNAPEYANNTSGRRGVAWHSGKWVAKINVNSKFIYLGRFTKFKDAVSARVGAEKKYLNGRAHNIDQLKA